MSVTSNEIKPRTVYLLKRTDKEDDGKDLYVGSTSKKLKYRLSSHKCPSSCERESKLYKRMREVGTDNWEIIPLLSFSCDQKTIREFEKEWCEAIGTDLNMISPFTDKKEYNANYRKLNNGAIKRKKAKYYESNRNTINQKKAKYYESNKEYISQQHAKYRKSTIQNRVHYCYACDKSFGSKIDLQRHLRSLKHSNAFMNSVD